MSNKINDPLDNSAINPNYHFSTIKYPRATANGISQLLQIDSNKKIKQQNSKYTINNFNDTSIHSFSKTSTTPPSPITRSTKVQDNKKKLKNDPFGDILKNKTKDFIRILFQNVGGLELSTMGHTLEVTCQSMKEYNIGIACLAETNTNWNHPKAKKQLYKLTKQFWKRSKLSTAMSKVP